MLSSFRHDLILAANFEESLCWRKLSTKHPRYTFRVTECASSKEPSSGLLAFPLCNRHWCSQIVQESLCSPMQGCMPVRLHLLR